MAWRISSSVTNPLCFPNFTNSSRFPFPANSFSFPFFFSFFPGFLREAVLKKRPRCFARFPSFLFFEIPFFGFLTGSFFFPVLCFRILFFPVFFFFLFAIPGSENLTLNTNSQIINQYLKNKNIFFSFSQY